MSKFLIIGGSGFIGTNLSKKLIELNHEVFVIDPNSPKKELQAFVKWVPVKIQDLKSYNLELNEFDAIYYLASLTGTAESNFKIAQYCEENIVAFASFLELINNILLTKKVILTSSRAVYGNSGKKRGDFLHYKHKYLNESSSLEPISVYGMTKLFQEKSLEMFAEEINKNLDYTILRLFNVYGSGQNVNDPNCGIVPIFTKQAYIHKKITLFEEGKPVRDFVHVDNVVQALISSLRLPTRSVINIGSGQAINLLQLAILIQSIVKTDIELLPKRRKGDVHSAVADISKMEKLLKIKPISPNEGIRNYLETLDFSQFVADKSIEQADSLLKTNFLYEEIK